MADEGARRIAFVHPDLGLGGAERLVVDAAAGLAERGYVVDVFTAFHDPKRSFTETVDGPFTVVVSGGWFPRALFGKCHAACAYIRCILIAFHIAWLGIRQRRHYDAIVVDQVSAVIPFLHLLTSSKVLFYCHHPDLLLAIRRPGVHGLYRAPLDWVEQATTGQADVILANSEYTAEVFQHTFTSLRARGIRPGVLHPACQIPSQADLEAARASATSALPPAVVAFTSSDPVFLSINRFERKKDVGLAIRALASLRDKGVSERGGGGAKRCKLVVAGGFDRRLAENREYLEELKDLVAERGLDDSVYFLPSFTDQQRSALLSACVALLYTPINEHFGIVPLEAMAAAKPVVACDSGGPRESVVHGQTGFLCRPTPDAFASAMQILLEKPEEALRLGENARKHVVAKFSRSAFAAKLDREIRDMIAR